MLATIQNILATDLTTVMNPYGFVIVGAVVGILLYRMISSIKLFTNKSEDTKKLDLQQILNSINHAVMITDETQVILAANKSAANFLRFDINSAVGENFNKLVDNSQLCEALQSYTNGQSDDVVHPQVIHEDGVIPGFNQVEFSKIIVDGKTKVVMVLNGSHHDEYATKIRERFIDRASHEFRTPLAAIQAYIEMLLDGEADDEKTRQAFYNIIQSETTRLTLLVDKVLKISSIEAGEVQTQMKVLNLDEIVDASIEKVLTQSDLKGVEFCRADNSSRGESLVFADEGLLSEAITNVINNAIKFTPRNNKVYVKTGVDVLHGVVTLEVKDEGVGISDVELPYIFEKFYRGETNEWYAKGAGLGLSLTKHIIKDVHGGTVKASSKIGKGSIFRIELPLRSNCVINSARESTYVEGSTL